MCVVPPALGPLPISRLTSPRFRRKKLSPSARRRRSSSSNTARSGRSSASAVRPLVSASLLVSVLMRIHLAVTWSQQGWDTPTPEIGRLWLRRHRILDDPWTGTYHWRDYGMGRRVPATPAAKAEVAAINEKLEPLLKAWQEEKDKTKYQMRKIEDFWHYMQDAIDYDFTIYKTMEKQYAEALVEPIDCSPPPPPPGPGHRRRFIEYVKRALPRRSTAEEPATNAHSLGVGEGFYRMRRRYFNERY
ncbi:uncharacterized protein RHOBADRAFT_22432 [Rhodotorula graminis WP1]|uniref:Uncharacterized protein n=1 Tax=Rhodotorula graminis (strain WP1) TaxID=578459 RepID=A0A0N8PZW2_RHOGW|nr:uncharacterized protein RHOBADRAFT_22432 [Rhodotorula graminis WP1]KPV73437.1 hypothetical protein RHOBADRAFT_22432 [Rhodotorula graminis WP1]